MATTTSNWPDDTNTGVQHGVTLSSAVPAGASVDAYGDLTITQAGATISGLVWNGMVIIAAPNVTLTNCQINSDSWYGVQVKPGVTGAVIQTCTITGGGMSDTAQTDGISGQGTFIGNNISNVRTGIVVTGASTIQDNYIHQLASAGTGASLPHYNGVEIDGGVSNITINHNTVVNTQGQTDAVMIDNVNGAISNVTVSNNLLGGGDFTIYDSAQFNSSAITGVSITNNHLATGTYGYTDFTGTSPTFTGNTYDGATLIAALNTSANDTGGSTPPSSGGTTPPPSSGGTTPPPSSGGTTGAKVGVTSVHEHWNGTVTLTGASNANGHVNIYDGTTKVGSVVADSTGAWSFTSSSQVTNSVHTYDAQEVSGSGATLATSNAAILGTRGADVLSSTAGNDLFNGNGGHDTFVFAKTFGVDVIQNFHTTGHSSDVIEFSKSDFQNFAAVMAHATQTGSDVQFTLAPHESVTLKNVNLASLSSLDFKFV